MSATDAQETLVPPRALRALPWLSVVFLASFFGSYGLVNTSMVLGLVAGLTVPEIRDRLRHGWPGKVGLALGGFIVWVLLSMLCSPESWVPGADRAFRTALKPLLALGFGFVVGGACAGLPRKAVRWMGWGTLLFMAPAITAMHENHISLYHSVYKKAILGHNVLAGILVTLLLHSLFLWQTGEDEPGWEKHVRHVLLLGGVALCGSRSAIVMLAVGLVTAVIWNLSARNLAKVGGIALLAIAGVMITSPRVRTSLNPASLRWEFGVRGIIWGQALKVIPQVPIFGCGARRYRDKLDSIMPKFLGLRPDGTAFATNDPSFRTDDPMAPGITRNPLEAHNDYLTIAAQHGGPGLAAWLLLHFAFLGAFCQAGKRGSGMARGAFAVVFGVGAYGLFNAVWFNKEFALFVYWFVGASLAIAATTTSSQAPEAETAPPAAA